MDSVNSKILSRECEATMVPSGDTISLPKGTKITITHRLGGNFTVVSDYGMFRIKGQDADAINESIPNFFQNKKDLNFYSKPVKEKNLWDALKLVFDPEIPVNIVDLGLIYSLKTNFILNKGTDVFIQMTLTAPGCGMGPVIAQDAQNQILNIQGVKNAMVDIIWDPPWTQDMISEEGKMQLGLI